MLKKFNSVFKNSIRRYCTPQIIHDKLKTVFHKEDGPPIVVADVPYSKYAGETTVTLLTNSKVGEEGAENIRSIFEHVNAPVEFEHLSHEKEIVPNEYLLSIMRNGTAIYLDVAHKIGAKQKSLLLNSQLDLFACVVNCFTIPGFNNKFPRTDIVIVMQNNRGDYSKLEYEPVKGVVETLKMCDKTSVERYIEFAFQYAIKKKRKRITFGHKANELPLSDGMYLEVAKRLHQTKYPNIEIESMLINRIAMHLIINPSRFDVLCLDNKYGTFVSSVASAMCGGAGLFCATEQGDNHAIFKPLQTKLSISDASHLCSYGTISTATNLLDYLGYHECANTLWRSLMRVMLEERIKTTEFGGTHCDSDVICKLLEVLQDAVCRSN